MTWLLLGLAAAVVALACGERAPMQDLPVEKRPWGGVDLTVRQRHEFELGKPGRAEYWLVGAAHEFVARCPEAKSDEPSFKEEAPLRLRLLPALTGGRCGRRGFEGSTIPPDPRAFDLKLPKLPAKVTLVEGDREAVVTIGADLRLEREDETGLVKYLPEAVKRLPDRLYLALGIDGSLQLWGGNIHVEPAPPPTLSGVVQYCRAPKPYEYAGGEADGQAYAQGVSDLEPEALYAELKKETPGVKLHALYLDGRERSLP